MGRNRYILTIASFLALSLVLTAGVSQAQSTGDKVAKATTPKASTPSASSSKSSAVALVDLNSATKQMLMTLPGINDASAQKIIANRPYHSKSDLTQKKVITADAYAKIASRIVAKTTTRVSPGNAEKRAASSKGIAEVQKKFQ